MNEHGIVDGSTYVKSDIWGGKRAANYYLGGDILRIDVFCALPSFTITSEIRSLRAIYADTYAKSFRSFASARTAINLIRAILKMRRDIGKKTAANA